MPLWLHIHPSYSSTGTPVAWETVKGENQKGNRPKTKDFKKRCRPHMLGESRCDKDLLVSILRTRWTEWSGESVYKLRTKTWGNDDGAWRAYDYCYTLYFRALFLLRLSDFGVSLLWFLNNNAKITCFTVLWLQTGDIFI